MSTQITESADRNVAESRIHALTHVTRLVTANNHAHHVSHHAKLTADIPNAHESAPTHALLAQKKNVFLHALIVHVPCLVLHHVITFHAH